MLTCKIPGLLEKGYGVVEVPQNIRELCYSYIEKEIHKRAADSQLSLTECVNRFSDDEFVEIFDKSQRFFPNDICQIIVEWVNKDLVSRLGGKKAFAHKPWNHKYNGEDYKDLYSEFDVCWRCVRPNKPDVGAAHADWQFWDIAHRELGDNVVDVEYDERWKLWIPLYGCNKSNGLQIVPSSHKKSVPFLTKRSKEGVLKPDIEQSWLKEHEKDFICPIECFDSQALLFDDLTVHQGPPNESDELRISAEITILLVK
ncbi:MAG: hypothetical protein S4CHLAM81_02840 [Chlamydiales bacterium]|nr:hypothetical protein [Chlamydiales bacterium]MCH9635075.1 hypothetical protein [Chlamydiales bacterium]MCH9703864.1 phytanoyl-CoA dioxygenase family protein [Chlamydiota bacterium]